VHRKESYRYGGGVAVLGKFEASMVSLQILKVPSRLMIPRSPGRFHVTNVAKLIAIYVVMNYDCELESKRGLNFEFREVLVPSPSVKLVMKKRA